MTTPPTHREHHNTTEGTRVEAFERRERLKCKNPADSDVCENSNVTEDVSPGVGSTRTDGCKYSEKSWFFSLSQILLWLITTYD
jgi:hypothetical protein